MSLKEWKNKELGQLLTNRWGFKMNLDGLTEEAGVLKENMPFEALPPAAPEPMGGPRMADPEMMMPPEEECDPCGCPDDEAPPEMGMMPPEELEPGMTRNPMGLEDRIYEKIMEMIRDSK